MTTNYCQTIITASSDCPVTQAQREPRAGTAAALQLKLLLEAPYTRTSDDLLFEVHAIHQGIAPADLSGTRGAFEAKSKAGLRTSPLVKTNGWGLHHDEESRVAAISMEEPAYARLAAEQTLKAVTGSARAALLRNDRQRRRTNAIARTPRNP